MLSNTEAAEMLEAFTLEAEREAAHAQARAFARLREMAEVDLKGHASPKLLTFLQTHESRLFNAARGDRKLCWRARLLIRIAIWATNR